MTELTTTTQETAAMPVSRAKHAPARKNPSPPGVQSIAIDNIEVLDQVRTELDPEQLGQLANSLERDGLLQPILLRPADKAGRFFVIAGERRFRAAQMLGWKQIPALVRTSTPSEASRLQLIENIQREELSLLDTAKGVLTLYQEHGDLATVCELLGKSKPWASKHIAVASKLVGPVQELLVSEEVSDLETLLLLNQIALLPGGYFRLDRYLDANKKPNRKTAKAFLEKEKAAIQASKDEPTQGDLDVEGEDSDEAQEKQAAAADGESAWNELQKIMAQLVDQQQDVDMVLDALDAVTRGKVESFAVEMTRANYLDAMEWPKGSNSASDLARHILCAARRNKSLTDGSWVQTAAAVLGVAGAPLDLYHLMREYQLLLIS